MYALIRELSTRELVGDQLPVLVTSLVLAEQFYKFHSFVLETVAFLATWFVLDGLLHLFARSLPADRSGDN